MQVEPICDCDITDVTFACGSILVTVTMRVTDDVNVVRLLNELQDEASRNSLPPFDVDASSLSLTVGSNGKVT